jgi:hypothetical protein
MKEDILKSAIEKYYGYFYDAISLGISGSNMDWVDSHVLVDITNVDIMNYPPTVSVTLDYLNNFKYSGSIKNGICTRVNPISTSAGLWTNRVFEPNLFINYSVSPVYNILSYFQLYLSNLVSGLYEELNKNKITFQSISVDTGIVSNKTHNIMVFVDGTILFESKVLTDKWNNCFKHISSNKRVFPKK